MESTGKVEGIYTAKDPATFVTREVPDFRVELAGIPGDRHYGLLRPADSRQNIYPRGTMIANRRQISIVSSEECMRIARQMGLPELKPEWLGANVLVSGLEILTELPAGVRFLFPDGTGLINEGENLPCIGPGKVIAEMIGDEGLARKFVSAALKLRGIVCSVEREGMIRRGDSFRILG